MVAMHHYWIAFFAFSVFGAGAIVSLPSKSFEVAMHGNPLMFIISGSFAVSIFFVLSGFVLSIGYFQTGKETVIKKLAAKRYLRLMLPALASVMLAYALISFGFSNTSAAATITHSAWLGNQWVFIPDFFEAAGNALWVIFTTGGSNYNNVLWTMATEFSGSFIVFGFLLFFGKSPYRWLAYVALSVFVYNSNIWLFGFVLGMLLADLYAAGRLVQRVRNIWLVTPLLAAALFLGGYPYANVSGTIYEFMMLGTYNIAPIYALIGATILVGVVVSATQVSRLFAHKYISILGKYTFSLYLVHIPILFTLTTFCFAQLYRTFGYTTSMILSTVISLPVIIIVTILFERFIDTPSVRFSSWVAKIYLGEVPLHLHPRIASLPAVRLVAKRITELKLRSMRPQTIEPKATE